MKLRKLARLCEHNEFGTHIYNTSKQTVATCPGGVFLPDDTLIIEKVDGEWPEWAKEILTYDFLVRDAE